MMPASRPVVAPRPVVEIARLSKTFGSGATKVPALIDIELTIGTGEVVGLIGPSGSGKSTLLNCIGCITEPVSGSIRLDGRAIFDGKWLIGDLRRMRLETIGFIFQFHNLLPFLSAWENVAIVRTLIGESTDRAKARAMELLGYLQVDHRADALPSKLSGGEAQRVAIARALANEPRIILADEPTAALDSERAAIVIDLMKQVAIERDAAVIVVTHDEKIFSRLDRMVHLRDGRIVEVVAQTAS
ncbi:ABC transporter ATP-binding protein [Bosea sp. 124]|uniref:ABC transporter ATP-binding protein n=1 Tax=Bosea sp. 124 TaxID=2135642 RepID=UPI000D440F4E|nr:ABC transporter ATP-binding protein [Bosea sp. 124]PTM41525.1 putative ABC transport system ATP-binding protein [Bosea sp. 124]